MNAHTGNTDRLSPITGRTSSFPVLTLNQDTLRRITALIQLGFGVLDGLIGLRFFLKLMAANPANPFAQLVYFLTEPFLWLFRGLTRTPSFEGIVIEFYDLIAMAVYAMLGWVIIQLLWILFSRRQ
ncbi:MAG: YggT family protein [Chloroflexota bacterium]